MTRVRRHHDERWGWQRGLSHRRQPDGEPRSWEYTWNEGNPNETTITFREATGDIEFAVVPEPNALALAGVGVAVAAWRLRRRRG